MDSKLFSSCFSSIYLLTVFFCFNSASSSTLSNETDRLSLLALMASIIDDPLGALSSWNNSIHFCLWNGVTCGGRHQRVIAIDLRSHKLAGPISPCIGNLSFLKQVYLQNNSLSGEIPPEVGLLRRLQTLDLRNNSLAGEIPANLSSCHDLIDIKLTFNQVGGKLPLELGSLIKLKGLYIGQNNFMSSIPSSFGNMTSLVVFYTSYNKLSGTIPSNLGHLKNLRDFAIGDNRFKGTIPPSIFNISSINVFDVGSNQLHRSLPSNLFTCFPRLNFFSIFSNKFTSSIPSSLSYASNLEELYLSKNNLTGKVLDLEKLHKLQMFGVAANSLGFGEVDDMNFMSSLTNATSLQIVQITTDSA